MILWCREGGGELPNAEVRRIFKSSSQFIKDHESCISILGVWIASGRLCHSVCFLAAYNSRPSRSEDLPLIRQVFVSRATMIAQAFAIDRRTTNNAYVKRAAISRKAFSST